MDWPAWLNCEELLTETGGKGEGMWSEDQGDGDEVGWEGGAN